MNYQELPAPPPLDTLVRCFWFLSGDAGDAAPQTVVTDGRLELILHLGEPFARLDDAGTPHTQDVALVSGQITAPLRVVGRGEVDVVGVRFRTLAAAAVLPVPLADLTDRIESLHAVAPSLARALYTAASRVREPVDRVHAMSRVLIRHATRPLDPAVVAAIAALEQNSATRVSQAADTVGLSARTFERRVLDHSGLPPSLLRRVMRFRRVFRMLDTSPAGTWSHVALRAGYFDQAHLIRDFRQFAGAAPSTFFGADPALARAILTGDNAR